MPGKKGERDAAATADQLTLITDEELDRAADGVAQEPLPEPTEVAEPGEEVPPEVEVKDGDDEETPEGTEVEPPKVDPEEHKERTRLGRKVAKLEDTLEKLLDQNRVLIEKLGPAEPARTEPEPTVEDVDFTDPKSIDHYLDLREKRKAEVARASTLEYEKGYLQGIHGWLKEAEKEGNVDSAEIYKLLTDTSSPFNVRRSNDSAHDLEINLAKAEAHFYRQKAAKPPEKKNPLEGNKDGANKPPAGVGGESKADVSKVVPTMKFSADEKAMIARMNWTEEQAAKFLTETKPPMHLVRGR